MSINTTKGKELQDTVSSKKNNLKKYKKGQKLGFWIRNLKKFPLRTRKFLEQHSHEKGIHQLTVKRVREA